MGGCEEVVRACVVWYGKKKSVGADLSATPHMRIWYVTWCNSCDIVA